MVILHRARIINGGFLAKLGWPDRPFRIQQRLSRKRPSTKLPSTEVRRMGNYVCSQPEVGTSARGPYLPSGGSLAGRCQGA